MQMKRERRDGYGMTRRPIDESREGRNKMDRNDCLRVGSLNVGSLNSRSYEVVDMMKRRRIDVLCVQETNWVGQESRRIDGYQIVYVGLNNQRNGVAIFIAPKYTGIIVEVIRPEVQHALYDRIIGLILDVDGKSFGIVSAYAPQAGLKRDEKERFYEELDMIVRSMAKCDILVVGGDFNGHVGRASDGFEGVHGGRGVGARNADGIKLLEFGDRHDLSILNTHFKKRKSQLLTYHSGKHHSQLDYLLVRSKDRRLVKDTKVFPSECVASQHKPVICDVWMMKDDMSGIKKKELMKVERRVKWWKLRDKEERDKFAVEVAIRGVLSADPLDASTNVDSLWNTMTGRMIECAREVLGETKGMKRKSDDRWFWSDEEVKKAVKEKRNAYWQWHRRKSKESWEAYKEKRRDCRRVVAIAKMKTFDDLYEKLNGPDGEKIVYRITKARDKESKDIQEVKSVKDEMGNILREEKEVKCRWEEYFRELLNVEKGQTRLNEGDKVQGVIPEWNELEVNLALSKCKWGKAMGPDGIPADCWKSIGDFGVRWLTRLMNRILEDGKMPDAWRKSEIVLIYKGKGDVRECGNYRGIKLLSHSMKLYEKMLDRRLRECVTLNESQFGFIPACSTAEPIFALRMLLERHYEFGMPVVAAFLDMEKAYDRTPRRQIWRSLRDRAVPERYIDLIKDTYEGASAMVRTPCGKTNEIPIQVGVHQGSALSPLLFITVLDSVLEGLICEAPQTMMYADDICIVGTDVKEVENSVRKYQTRLNEAGLTLNTGKTEFIGFECGNGLMTDVNHTAIKRVEQFKYLGAMITVDGSAEKDIEHRIKCAWMKWRGCGGVMNDRRISLKLKGKVYKSVIRPTLLYGSEMWPISERQMDKMMVVEMKMLRWACGLNVRDRVRNEAIRAMTKCAKLEGKIRERRLRWFGHVKRREKEHVCRRMMTYTIRGKRPVGRPKLRWSEMIKQDITQLRLTERHALNRDLWKTKTSFPDPV